MDSQSSELHLDLGGPDSDASRATSAVNKSNTSESAGGSPHASTSSTSDREQSSIQEDSSVSTDAGMDSLQYLRDQLLLFGYPVQISAAVMHPL